jgi:hypothetical protein
MTIQGIKARISSSGCAYPVFFPASGHEKAPVNRGPVMLKHADQTIRGMISKATMLMILISGLIAGPAVSL